MTFKNGLLIAGGIVTVLYIIKKLNTAGVSKIRKEFDMAKNTANRETHFDTSNAKSVNENG